MKVYISEVFPAINRLERIKRYLYLRFQRTRTKDAFKKYINQTKVLSKRANKLLGVNNESGNS